MYGFLNDGEMDDVLRRADFGRIGCHADGRTYVVPTSYVYENASVYAHSMQGNKVRLMRSNPNVCFQADVVRSVNDWRSVILWGRYEELEGNEAREALHLLQNRFRTTEGHLATPEPAAAHVSRISRFHAIVFRIAVRERSGRFETDDGSPTFWSRNPSG